ncbi:MAG: hypothetical protein IJ461_03780 [Clostridia bacterium]|nr:hypothetical protein [Clostridia bacterium]
METEKMKRLAQVLAAEEEAQRPERILAEGGAPEAAAQAAVPGAGAAGQEMQEALLRGLGAETAELLREMGVKPDADQEEAQMQERFRQLWEQAQALKKLMPNFDLDREMQNPAFVHLVQPQVGLDVETAFRVAHGRELEPLLMQYAARQAAQQLAQSVATGQMRPPENGARQGAAVMQEDPRLWSPEQKAEVRERVRKGERVIL